MQVLTLKKRDDNGKEITVVVKVLRLWMDASGSHVYLHSNGVYGYKDGSPVCDKKEFEIIGSRVQREMALSWWNASGEELSNKFYDAQTQKERARQGDFHEQLPTDNTSLDHALYRRREVKPGSKKPAWGEPFAWMEAFSRRPDWWGQAEKIALPDYEYEKTRDLAGQTVSGDVDAEEV